MRVLVLAVSATFLLLPAAANACGAKASAQAATADLSAQTKKPAKKAVKVKKEKVEYMRAAPMK